VVNAISANIPNAGNFARAFAHCRLPTAIDHKYRQPILGVTSQWIDGACESGGRYLQRAHNMIGVANTSYDFHQCRGECDHPITRSVDLSSLVRRLSFHDCTGGHRGRAIDPGIVVRWVAQRPLRPAYT
jgi:hypothetical protein